MAVLVLALLVLSDLFSDSVDGIIIYIHLAVRIKFCVRLVWRRQGLNSRCRCPSGLALGYGVETQLIDIKLSFPFFVYYIKSGLPFDLIILLESLKKIIKAIILQVLILLLPLPHHLALP